MGERDAFGREKDEDTLSGLGWDRSNPNIGHHVDVPHEQVQPQVIAPTTPTTPPTPTVTFGVPGRPAKAPTIPPIPGANAGMPNVSRVITRVTRMFSIAVVVVIIGAIAAGVISSLDTVDNVKNSISNAFTVPSVSIPSVSVPTPEQPAAPSTPSKPSSPPVGLQPGSLLRQAQFRTALRRLRAKGGRLLTLRAEPSRIDAQSISSTGKLRVMQVSYDGGLRVIATTNGSFSGVQTLSFSQVNSAAPSRAVARAAGRLERGASTVNYLVLTSFAGTPQWVVYFKDGKYFTTSADGREVTRAG